MCGLTAISHTHDGDPNPSVRELWLRRPRECSKSPAVRGVPTHAARTKPPSQEQVFTASHVSAALGTGHSRWPNRGGRGWCRGRRGDGRMAGAGIPAGETHGVEARDVAEAGVSMVGAPPIGDRETFIPPPTREPTLSPTRTWMGAGGKRSGLGPRLAGGERASWMTTWRGWARARPSQECNCWTATWGQPRDACAGGGRKGGGEGNHRSS